MKKIASMNKREVLETLNKLAKLQSKLLNKLGTEGEVSLEIFTPKSEHLTNTSIKVTVEETFYNKHNDPITPIKIIYKCVMDGSHYVMNLMAHCAWSYKGISSEFGRTYVDGLKPEGLDELGSGWIPEDTVSFTCDGEELSKDDPRAEYIFTHENWYNLLEEEKKKDSFKYGLQEEEEKVEEGILESEGEERSWRQTQRMLTRD